MGVGFTTRFGPQVFARGKAKAALDPIKRKDVRDLSDDEKTKYAEAFRRLKTKGPDRPKWQGGQLIFPDPQTLDKTGYAFQALLHTNHCPHGNWWFLPWHRVYLFYLEQILQEAVKDFMTTVPLAIPYWNWTEQRDVPDLFLGDPQKNPLADERRFPQPLQDSDVGPDVISQTVDQAGSFSAFGSLPACTQRDPVGAGDFETIPHGNVHVKIGWYDGTPQPGFPQGLPGTFRIPPTSGFDPIFWSHHANIDRLWDVWLSQTGHGNPDWEEACPDGSVTWGGLHFNEFVDRQGQPLDRSVQDFLTDQELKRVVYQNHQGETILVRKGKAVKDHSHTPFEVKASMAANVSPRLQIGKPVNLSIPVAGPLQQRLHALGQADQPKETVLFVIEGLEIPKNYPAVALRAFLNKSDATEETPLDDPHRVGGDRTFFGLDHPHGEHAGMGAGMVLNLTPTLRHLEGKVDLGKPLTVTLVLIPLQAANHKAALPKDLSVPFKSGRLILTR